MAYSIRIDMRSAREELEHALRDTEAQIMYLLTPAERENYKRLKQKVEDERQAGINKAWNTFFIALAALGIAAALLSW